MNCTCCAEGLNTTLCFVLIKIGGMCERTMRELVQEMLRMDDRVLCMCVLQSRQPRWADVLTVIKVVGVSEL